MISTADHSTGGHIGFEFVVSEGDHKQVARGLAEMVSYTRICFGCLQRAWRDGMTTVEATEALRSAKEACDAFCTSCAAGDADCFHAGQHWTQRRCTSCEQAGTECVKLFVLGASLDCGGAQAGLIRRSLDDALETDDDPYHEEGGARLYGLPILPDGAHFVKSVDSNQFHHKIWVDGWLCGAFQLWSCFWDADPVRRSRVRTYLTRELLRRKNAFSVEAAVARMERLLLDALLSDAERTAGQAWLVSTLGPARCRAWRENTPNMYAQPMGAAFQARSNLVFYIDLKLKQGRVLKLAHTPCDNAAFTAAPRSASALSQLRRPVDIALIGTDAYITDEHHDRPALYVVSVAHICKSFSTAEQGGGSSSSSSSSSSGSSSCGSVERVKLNGVVIRQPFGIATDPANSHELFVGCRQAAAIIRVTLASTNVGVAEMLCVLPAPPAGIDVVPATESIPARLVVAAGDAVFLVDREHGSVLRILQRDGAAFCGVRIAPITLGGDLFAIDHAGNAVLRLARAVSSSAMAFQPSAAAVTLVGGNVERPCSAKAAFWYEGTASRVQLCEPTFGVFARNAFIFMNAGRGEYGKVLLLNDLYPMAAKLAPAMLTAANAFCLTRDAQHHPLDRLHAALMLEPLADLLGRIEDGNAEVHSARGLQGEIGNFSNVVRRSSQQLPTLLLQQVANAAQIGAPQRCLDSLSITSVTTLDVESFFIGQRSHWPNPYAAQYGQSHALAMLIESSRRGDTAFSVCMTNTKPSHSGRRHYHGSGILSVAESRYQPSRAKPGRAGMSVDRRQKRLRVLRALAALFRQSRQQRVTDKGKEKPGTKPAVFYGPKVAAATDDHHDSELLGGDGSKIAGHSAATLVGDGGASASTSTAGGGASASSLLYRGGDIVLVRPLLSQLWLAQLLEPIVESSPGCFNTDRPSCRYFIPTSELAAFPHALSWWSKCGVERRITDEAGAIARSTQSDGVHFSFEKRDHVTRSTICGCLSPSCLSERVFSSNELVSFAITDQELASARELVSGLATAEEEEEAAMQAAQAVQSVQGQAAERAAEEEARAAAAASFATLNQKRKAGKEREDRKKEATQSKARK
jgi:hypothetical protein